MATQTVNGYNLNNVLVEETGRISEDIYRNTIDTTAWLKLFPQEQWDDEMGDTVSVLTYERTLPTGTQVWSPINSDSTKFCVPDKTVISSATTTQTYGLAHTAVESDPLCINDVRMSFRFREQLANVYANLTENTALLWRDRNRSEYFRLAKHKLVAQRTSVTGGLSRNYGTAYMPGLLDPGGNATAVSRLTQGILDSVRMQMITDGAGTNPMGRENGAPVFTLITSAESSAKIIRELAIREDFRNSSRVNELLQPLGVERAYGGFYHVIDTFPARWNALNVTTAESIKLEAAGKLTFTNATGLTVGSLVTIGTKAPLLVVAKTGATVFTVTNPDGTAATEFTAANLAYTAWVPVPAYIEDTTQWDGKKTGTSRWLVNDAYFTAEYEDSYIYHQDVMKVLIPRPLTSAGSNVTFNANTYRGDFKWLNIQDRVENPDGSWGFFRGVLASASKPGRNQFGYVIRHRRCDMIELLDCADAKITG